MNRLILCTTLLIAMGTLTACRESAPAAPPPTPEVSVLTLETSMIHPTRNMVGRTVSSQEAEVRPQVRGIVQEVLFKEGGMVKAGTVLYRIEPDTYQVALNSAKAALSKAEANLEASRLKADRASGLRKSNAVSQQSDEDARAAYTQARADVESARAALDKASIDLRRAEVTAPIDGYIGKSSVTVGALVTADQATPLTTIYQTDPMYVDVPMTAEEVRALRAVAGDDYSSDDVAVQLQLGDGSWYERNGKLRFADVNVNADTGSILCRAEFVNPNRALLPGLYVNVVGTTEKTLPALLVPQRAVQRDSKGEPYVLVVGSDNKVERRAIITGRTVEGRWLVKSGLTTGERVVVEGLQKARPGTTVRATAYAEVSKELATVPAPDRATSGS